MSQRVQRSMRRCPFYHYRALLLNPCIKCLSCDCRDRQEPGQEVSIPRLDFTFILAPGGSASFSAAEANGWSVSQRARFLRK